LNAPLSSTATYAPDHIINALKQNTFVITTTLNLPENHEFIIGKPEIKEKIIEITPVYAVLGPLLKQDAKSLVTHIKTHQDELIKIVEETGDLSWDAFPDISAPENSTSLIKDNIIMIKKEPHIVGKNDKTIVQIDDIYLEITNEG